MIAKQKNKNQIRLLFITYLALCSNNDLEIVQSLHMQVYLPSVQRNAWFFSFPHERDKPVFHFFQVAFIAELDLRAE